MTVKENGAIGKVQIDRFWLSIGLPILAYVFTAGIGWNRLSYAETAVAKLETQLENIKTDKYDTVAKLTTVSNRLEEVVRNLERMNGQMDTLAK